MCAAQCDGFANNAAGALHRPQKLLLQPAGTKASYQAMTGANVDNVGGFLPRAKHRHVSDDSELDSITIS